MIPRLDFSSLEHPRWRRLALRFVLGGAVTVATGLIASHWGPVIGGLFLAFPAIFPATVTLVDQDEKEKKSSAGIDGHRRGRKAAALDASGAIIGGWGLAAFGAIAWLLLPAHAAGWALTLAGAGWLVVALGLWWLRRRWRSSHRG